MFDYYPGVHIKRALRKIGKNLKDTCFIIIKTKAGIFYGKKTLNFLIITVNSKREKTTSNDLLQKVKCISKEVRTTVPEIKHWKNGRLIMSRYFTTIFRIKIFLTHLNHIIISTEYNVNGHRTEVSVEKIYKLFVGTNENVGVSLYS